MRGHSLSLATAVASHPLWKAVVFTKNCDDPLLTFVYEIGPSWHPDWLARLLS